MLSGMKAMCGIDCACCRVFRATIDNDDAARAEIRQYYKGIGHDIVPEDLHCLGCGSDVMMPACAGCPYMKCGRERGLACCDECGEYPCESLRWYTEKYIKPSIGKLIIAE